MNITPSDKQIIMHFFKPYAFPCLGVFVLMVCSGLIDTANIAALYLIINYGLALDKGGFFLDKFEALVSPWTGGNHFQAACWLLIAVSILAFVLRIAYNYCSNKLAIHIVGNTQKHVYHKLAGASYDFFVRHAQGRLIYAGTTAAERIFIVVSYTMTLAYFIINGAFLFSMLVVLNWQATCFIVGLAIVYGGILRKVIKSLISRYSAISVEENQKKNVALNEFITGIKPIKIFLAQREWQSKYMKAVDGALFSHFRSMMVKLFPEPLVKFLFFMAIAVTGLLLSHKESNEIIAMLPMLGAFVLVVNRFLPTIDAIGGAMMSLASALPDARIVYNLLNENAVPVPEGQQELLSFKNSISFQQVSFQYPSSEGLILNQVSFNIEKEKITAIVGPSGSGKTTLVGLLLKLYSPGSGRITIDGVDIAGVSTASYLSKIGYIGQETFLFNASIRENIRFGMDNCSLEMIEEAAKLAHAHGFIMETPQGYDTMVGDAGVKLSGGQRQRIAIARAILRKPAILVLDEATSSLDNISEKMVQDAIIHIAQNTTVVVIAHRLTTVQNADKIVIMDKGRIIEQGTHEELLRNKDLYYALQTGMNNETAQ